MVVRRLGPGDDTFRATAQGDSIFGEGGNDVIYGDRGNDTLSGGTDNDRLFGEAGDDQLVGKEGADILDGGIGKDYAWGGLGADTVYGRAGNDVLYGGLSDRDASDGATDRVFGGDGADLFVAADASRDLLFGEAGDDRFFASNDTVRGGEGFDVFSVGGAGSNDLTLGGDIDLVYFSFQRADESDSVIRDFTAEDRLVVTVRTASGFLPREPLFDALDSSDDGRITAADNGKRTFDGVPVGVAADGDGLTLSLNGGTVAFEGAAAINGDQWF